MNGAVREPSLRDSQPQAFESLAGQSRKTKRGHLSRTVRVFKSRSHDSHLRVVDQEIQQRRHRARTNLGIRIQQVNEVGGMLTIKQRSNCGVVSEGKASVLVEGQQVTPSAVALSVDGVANDVRRVIA